MAFRAVPAYFRLILRATGWAGPENNLWFSINGPGCFLLAPGRPGYKSAGPCHLYIERISVSGSPSNWILHFRTGPGSEWISKKILPDEIWILKCRWSL